MTSTQVVETSVTNNSSFQSYSHSDDHNIRTKDKGTSDLYNNEEMDLKKCKNLTVILMPFQHSELVVALINKIQLFRQRLSHKSVKAYATMPISIMGRTSLAFID